MKTRLVRQLLVEKDAEIERLQAENKVTVSVCNENTDLKKLISELEAEIEGLQKRVLEFIDRDIADRKLISELADALSHYALLNDFEKSLLQSAQEATK